VLTDDMKQILAAARSHGWVLEPDAKRLLSLAGLDVPRFARARTREEARQAAAAIGYPVVVKVVSPKVVHKSDVKGVAVGIEDESGLDRVFERFSKLQEFQGVLVEEMVSGLELIIGAKIDYQFGAVVLLGVGGTLAEIYQDTAVRMAPLSERDVQSMISGLKAGKLLTGYRGSAPVDSAALSRLVVGFSELLMQIADEVESIDLNPVMCSAQRCVVADARIVLDSHLPGNNHQSDGCQSRNDHPRSPY
jgi:succinyl-CoA synthetase beta subunit